MSPSKGAKTFQFHKGTIKTIIFSRRPGTAEHFNSIKVQLKHAFLGDVSASGNVFQFHKGTIKTVPSVVISLCLMLISIP